MSVGFNLDADESNDVEDPCPECGEDCEILPFEIAADTEEIAQRVFRAYIACMNLTDDELVLIEEGKAHIHIELNEDCAE